MEVGLDKQEIGSIETSSNNKVQGLVFSSRKTRSGRVMRYKGETSSTSVFVKSYQPR